jgi:hypothetical protein
MERFTMPQWSQAVRAFAAAFEARAMARRKDCGWRG